MPGVRDFRSVAFDVAKIDASGKDLGKKVYWKLYAIENVVRVIVHSVLTAQIDPNWWSLAVDPDTQKNVDRLRSSYAKRPWHSTPGKHDIYYLFLSDLNTIITSHSHLFQPYIPDIDHWIVEIERVRVPRNIVGHMNWLTTADRSRIDVLHADLQHLAGQLSAAGLSLVVP